VKIAGKGLTLRGEGVDRTVITDSMPSANVLEAEINNTNSLLRITGFTFNANNIAKTTALAEMVVSASSDAIDKFKDSVDAQLIPQTELKPGNEGYPNDLEMLVEGRGSHFDPALVDLFIGASEEVRAVATNYRD